MFDLSPESPMGAKAALKSSQTFAFAFVVAAICILVDAIVVPLVCGDLAS